MRFQKCCFKPKKVLILSKLTRLEYERQTHPLLNETQLKKEVKFVCPKFSFAPLHLKNCLTVFCFLKWHFFKLARRGSNYERLRKRYDEHYQFLNFVICELRFVDCFFARIWYKFISFFSWENFFQVRMF